MRARTGRDSRWEGLAAVGAPKRAPSEADPVGEMMVAAVFRQSER